jgi:hypothetical protein
MIADRAMTVAQMSETHPKSRNSDPPRGYHCYHIETGPSPDIGPYTSRFCARVGKAGLERLLLGVSLFT